MLELLVQSGLKLAAPDPGAVRAAREAIENSLAEEKAARREIELHAPRSTWAEWWAVLKARIKRVFIEPAEERSAHGSSGQDSSGRIRPVPVALAGLSSIAIGYLVYRRFRKRKP